MKQAKEQTYTERNQVSPRALKEETFAAGRHEGTPIERAKFQYTDNNVTAHRGYIEDA